MSDFISVKVDFPGYLLNDFKKLNELLDKALREEIGIAADYVLGQMQRATPVGVTGTTRRAWFRSPVIQTKEGPRTEISNPTESLMALDQGRRAAMPPVEPIMLWCRRKLGLRPKEAWKAAWGIAIRKKNRATPGQNFVGPSAEKALPKAGRLLVAALGARLSVVLAAGESHTEKFGH